MIMPVFQYIRDEGLPRRWKILISPETGIGVAVSALCLIWGKHWFSQSPKVGDLTTGLIAYAAIALGFCVAGLTISLTLPDRDFASQLAVLRDHEESTNAYSDLLFVFSWTAIAHWVALVVLFVTMLFVESNCPLYPYGAPWPRNWTISIVAGICAYCLCQFLITLITLSQVGRVYIQHLIDQHGEEGRRTSPVEKP
jgi:hypothetical protein